MAGNLSTRGIYDETCMDMGDLSYYLKVKAKTLYAMVREIPHYRIGKLIRFKKTEIDAWMQSKRARGKDEKKQPKEKRKPLETANLNIDRLIPLPHIKILPNEK